MWTLIYLSCDHVNSLKEISTLFNGFEDIYNRMSQNVLQLNTFKTEILIIVLAIATPDFK